MKKTARTRTVLGECPEHITNDHGVKLEIPEGWVIFNAPRPLYASEIALFVRHDEFKGDVFNYVYATWVGDFKHGIFYVAVDPEDEATWNSNVSNDGWILEFRSAEHAQKVMQRYYRIKYHKDFTLDECAEAVVTYFSMKNERK